MKRLFLIILFCCVASTANAWVLNKQTEDQFAWFFNYTIKVTPAALTANPVANIFIVTAFKNNFPTKPLARAWADQQAAAAQATALK